MPAYAGMDRFVAAFDKLVVQSRRSRSRVPVVLLAEPDGGGAGRRIVQGLRARLRGDAAMLAPHAYLPPAAQDPPQLEMFEQVALQLADSMPRGTGQLRLPGYRLLHAVLTAPRLEGPLEQRHDTLRDHCYADHRRWSAPARTLWWLGGRNQAGGGSMVELLWNFVAGPLFQRLPCWLFGMRSNRRILGHGRSRRWYAQWYRQQHGAPPTDFFRSALDLVREDGTDGGRDGEQTDRVLMHALLSDLDAATRYHRLSPWRRRRSTRFVLLLEELGHADSRTQRFVRELRAATEDLGSTSVLVVAAGARSLAARVPDIEPADLAHAGAELDLVEQRGVLPGQPSGMAVPVRADAPEDDQQAAYWLGRRPRLVPPVHRLGPGAELAGYAGVLGLALAVLAGLFVLRLPLPGVGGQDDCRGETFLGTDGACVGVAEGAKGFGDSPGEKGVREALGLIEAQNQKVEAEMRTRPGDDPRARARTVVYLGPLSGGKGADDPVRGGTLPELRGLALAQARINELALDGGDRVPLRVLTANAGNRFQDARQVAEQIAQLARQDPAILGVVGFGQSRPGTLEAIDVLDAAGIPMVGTSGTAADLLERGPYYYQAAPANSRAAQIMAAFLRQANTVGGGKERAQRVELVADPTDIYSKDLAADFERAYGAARTTVRRYTPADSRGSRPVPGAPRGTLAPSAPDLARQICGAVEKAPRTAVVWTARAGEFTDFLQEVDRIGERCPRITVLGGDDVTNSLVQDEHPQDHFAGLTLFYVTHGNAPELVRAGGAAAAEAGQFTRAYDREAKRLKWGAAMRTDGHPVLAWDALRYLSEAVDEARASVDGAEERLVASQVQAVLYQGLGAGGFNGATGRIDSAGAAGGGRATPDKLVFVMRAGDGASRTEHAELVCGALTKGRVRTEWGAGGYACPGA